MAILKAIYLQLFLQHLPVPLLQVNFVLLHWNVAFKRSSAPPNNCLHEEHSNPASESDLTSVFIYCFSFFAASHFHNKISSAVTGEDDAGLWSKSFLVTISVLFATVCKCYLETVTNTYACNPSEIDFMFLYSSC